MLFKLVTIKKLYLTTRTTCSSFKKGQFYKHYIVKSYGNEFLMWINPVLVNNVQIDLNPVTKLLIQFTLPSGHHCLNKVKGKVQPLARKPLDAARN